MKASVVIACWNGIDLIQNCLQSIFSGAHANQFEVIISDNGSADGLADFVRQHYPQVRVIENGVNLGYAKGNNAAIPFCSGQYILFLNSDTKVQEGALDALVAFADKNPRAGAFGCRVFDGQGSRQVSARPFPTLWRDWLDALWIPHFHGAETRLWQSGCCLMLRADLLRELGGFDERFFYSYEDVDLCWRVWEQGYSVATVTDAAIIHLGGGSANRLPTQFEIERHHSRYVYFLKHYGPASLGPCRNAALLRTRLRQYAYAALSLLNRDFAKKAQIHRVAAEWNLAFDAVRFAELGETPPVPGLHPDFLVHPQSLI